MSHAIVRSAVLLAALVAASANPCLAAESSWPRWYLGVRLGTAVLPDTEPGPGIEVTPVQQATGLSLGVDLGRHLGLELAADAFEPDLSSGRSVGEYGVFTLIPQVRVRYPVLGGRLTPYALAGVGVMHTEFNDRKENVIGVRIRAGETLAVGAVGLGVDYALAEDLALGVEMRYLLSGGHRMEIGDNRADVRLDTLLIGAVLRMTLAGGAAESGSPLPTAPAGRFYLTGRYGGAVALEERVGGGIELEAEHSAVGGGFNSLFGVGFGRDLGPFLGVELVADGHERNLAVRGVGLVAEYSVYSVVPQLRARYPLGDGRLVPYALAGVGVAYVELNDLKPRSVDLRLRETGEWGVVGAAGVGLEYLVSPHVAVGLEAKYHATRGPELRLAGRSHDVALDTLLVTAGLRIYLPGL